MNATKGFFGVLLFASFYCRLCIASQLSGEGFLIDHLSKRFPPPSAPPEIFPSPLSTRCKNHQREKCTEKLSFNATAAGVSRNNLSKMAVAHDGAHTSRLKRMVTPASLETVNASFMFQQEDVLRFDHSLEALLRGFVEDQLEGCDLIIIIDRVFQGSRTLETLMAFPVIKQVLQPTSVDDLTEKIEWETKNCVGTFLLTGLDFLISFGDINKFHWSYKAKVFIVGSSLQPLEVFLKTKKGRKVEHVIGIIEDPSKNQFSIYMNQLFWGEGFRRMTTWRGHDYTREVDLFPDKISNLQKANITVVLFEWRPIIFFEYYENGTIKKRHGRDLTLMDALAKAFNYTIDFKDIPMVYGVKYPNGSWTGFIGHMQRDEAHIGTCHLYSGGVDDMHKEQDYSRPIEDDNGCFMIRREHPMPSWQAPILPFTLGTWIAFIIGLIISGPIFYAIVMASTLVGEELEIYKSLSYTTLASVAVNFEYPLGILPKQLSTQIFLSFLLIYNLVLSTGYKSNLISFLTVARPPKRIETFKDLVESNMPVRTFPSWGMVLSHMENPYLKKIAANYETRMTSEENIPSIMKGETSIMNSRDNLEAVMGLLKTRSGKPVTRLLKECVMTFSVGIGFQWHTPLKPKFNRILANLVERGFTRLWFVQAIEEYRKLQEKEGKVTYYEDFWHASGDELIPLTVGHTQGIFIIIALGYFLAAISFAVEVYS